MNIRRLLWWLTLIALLPFCTLEAEDSASPHNVESSWICGARLPLRPKLSLHSPFPNGANRLWPDGKIPYTFDGTISPTNRQKMLDAMKEWQDAAGVRFVPRDGEDGYVLITTNAIPNKGSYGPGVGHFGDERKLQIGSDAWSRGLLLHELGHALGFWHTQSRTDREPYIRIETANIVPDAENASQFDVADESLTYGDYDFASIMHCRACQLSHCGESSCSATSADCRTITVLPPYDAEWQAEIGFANKLSAMDKLTMSLLYAPADWKFVDAASRNDPGRGTFFDRYRRFTTAEVAVGERGTIIVQPGTYAIGALHAKPMTIQAPLGGVTFVK